MFSTIGHTFELIGMSWRVLMKDRELMLFPIMGGIGVGITIAIFYFIALGAGTFDRLESETAQFTGVDLIVTLLFYATVYFVTIFFNAALVAAALERLRGGDPDVGSGLRKALSHTHNILGWALIAATVGLIFQMLRGRSNNFLYQIMIGIVGGLWAIMTFFVIPVLVSEGVGPITAIQRSAGLIRRTWGRQVTANFGFFFLYLVALVIVIVPALLIGAIAPLAGVIVAAIVGAIAFSAVQALEGIFKAALFEYAMGEKPAEFDLRTLQTAYRPA